MFIPGRFEGAQVRLCFFDGGGLVNRLEIGGDDCGRFAKLRSSRM